MPQTPDRAEQTRRFIGFLNELERLCHDHGVVLEASGDKAAIVMASLSERTTLSERYYGAPQKFLGYALKSPRSINVPRWHDGDALVLPIEATYGLAAPKAEQHGQALCKVCGGPGYLIGRERNVTCDVCGGTGVRP